MFRKSKTKSSQEHISKPSTSSVFQDVGMKRLANNQALFESWPLTTPAECDYSFEWEGYGGLFLGIVVRMIYRPKRFFNST